MSPRLQELLLLCYRTVVRTGVLDTRLGRSLLESSYNLYKAFFEAGSVEQLQQFVSPGSTVIDVGANVGFFSRRFAKWVSDTGRVVAIEPAPDHCRNLERALTRQGMAHRVEVIRAVATQSAGTRFLELNPHNPSDHKIGERGLEVAAVTIDGLMAERDWPPVSLMKLDVQGAEYQVLAGSQETVRQFRPVLFIEVQEESLRRLGSSPEEVLGWATARGYSIHTLEKHGISSPEPLEEALRIVDQSRNGYCDFLMLPSQPSDGRPAGVRTHTGLET